MTQADTTREYRRLQFEFIVRTAWNNDPRFEAFDLSPLIVNDVFHKYMDPDTDTAWIGFQLARIFDARVRTGVIDALSPLNKNPAV